MTQRQRQLRLRLSAFFLSLCSWANNAKAATTQCVWLIAGNLYYIDRQTQTQTQTRAPTVDGKKRQLTTSNNNNNKAKIIISIICSSIIIIICSISTASRASSAPTSYGRLLTCLPLLTFGAAIWHFCSTLWLLFLFLELNLYLLA